MAIHRLYREAYAAHGNKEMYSAEEGLKVVDTFLAGFADAFGAKKHFFVRQYQLSLQTLARQ